MKGLELFFFFAAAGCLILTFLVGNPNYDGVISGVLIAGVINQLAQWYGDRRL